MSDNINKDIMERDKEKQKEERKLNFLNPYFARAMLDDLVQDKPLNLEHIANDYDNIEGPGCCTSFWCNKDHDFLGKHLREAPECLKEAEQIYTGTYSSDPHMRNLKQISDNDDDTFSDISGSSFVSQLEEDFDYFTMQGSLSSENILRLRGGDEVLKCSVCESELDFHYRCNKPDCIRVLRNLFHVKV